MRYTIDEIYSKKNKKEKRQKIIRILIYILIIPLLIYNFIILYQVVAFSNTTPNFFGYKTFVIISGSMEPELQIGDIVVIKNVEKKDLEVGDIISFRDGNSIITHRIIEINEENKYKTKGDANTSEDKKLVDFVDVEGEYAFRIPKIGSVVVFLQNKVGIICVMIFVYILYIINKSKEEKIMKRKEKREIYEKINNDK